MLSGLVIPFLPRSKRLLISWLQSPSAVILEPPKIKSDTVSPSISHEVMGPDSTILVKWQKCAGCDGPHSSMAERSYPTSEIRGSGREEQPHVQGVVAVRVQEGREELLHVQGQEGQQ